MDYHRFNKIGVQYTTTKPNKNPHPVVIDSQTRAKRKPHAQEPNKTRKNWNNTSKIQYSLI